MVGVRSWRTQRGTDTGNGRAAAKDSATRFDGGNAYVSAVTGYDDAYQPTGQSLTLPTAEGKLAGTYTTKYTYTLDEQLKTQTMTALANLPSETVTTSYDRLSQPQWLTGGLGRGVYVAGASYSSFGDLLSLDLGNSYSDYLTYTYEQGTRRLSTQTFQRETVTGNDLALAYTYDDAGNITQVADTPSVAGMAGDTQCFSYDGLQRLTGAWTPASSGCSQAPSVAGLGGAAPYWSEYGYDGAGDRTSQTVHAAAGSTTSTYSYPATGASHVHGVSQVATSGPAGSTTSTYAYDASGNTTSRAVAGQSAQTLTWDVEGRLASVSAGGVQVEANLYSAGGDRLIRRQGSTVTAYLPGGQELTLNTTTQALTAVRYYAFGGQTVAVRSGSGFAGVASLVPDQQGTALVTVANVTNVSTRRWADPFGGARGASPAGWTGDHGFLNKVADSTGLTAVGARFYDSAIGRFVSVDPVLNRSDPQQWNGYAYSQNNPVTWSDPSGLLSWGSALKSASGWYKQHQAQIWGVAAGIIVTAGCMAITFGAGSIACAAAGGAAAGAVTNVWASKIAHTQTFSWKSLIVDTVIGGVIGAATGGLGKLAAPLMSRAGTAIATTAKTLAARAPAAARAATGAIGRAASSIGRASSSTARAALRSETRVGTANTAEGAGVVRYGPGAQRAGEPSWPRPTQDNCTQCAQEIQGIMGGERAMIRPNAPGAKVLGPSANNPGGDWAYHDVVVSGGRVYDGFTGPNGLPFDQFKAQFDYPDAIDFGF